MKEVHRHCLPECAVPVTEKLFEKYLLNLKLRFCAALFVKGKTKATEMYDIRVPTK